MNNPKSKIHNLKFKKLWIGIVILIFLAPIGLILPKILKAGGAWGEWGADELKDIIGYIPEGLKRLSEIWSAPLSGYTFHGWDKGLKSCMAYIISGLLGVALIVAIVYILAHILKRGEHE